MRRSLAALFIILSLSIFFCIESDRNELCGTKDITSQLIEDAEQSFSQGDNYIDLYGHRRASSTFSTIKTISKNSPSRRNILDSLSGVKFAIANLYSECSYSYSCGFPFEHQPERELFFILRNIRI